MAAVQPACPASLLPDGAWKRPWTSGGDIDPARAELLPVLERLGIPGPRLIPGPAPRPSGQRDVENWNGMDLETLVRNAARRELAAVGAWVGRRTASGWRRSGRLRPLTDCRASRRACKPTPPGPNLERRTLADEVAILTDDARWDADPWLAEEGRARSPMARRPVVCGLLLAKVRAAVADIHDPLVYTQLRTLLPVVLPDHCPPMRSTSRSAPPETRRMQKNPLVEFVQPLRPLRRPAAGPGDGVGATTATRSCIRASWSSSCGGAG